MTLRDRLGCTFVSHWPRLESGRPLLSGEGRPHQTAVTFKRFAATITILLLSACAPQLPPVSADTSCERFRHISATDAQIKIFADNWGVLESYADQVVAHNVTYDEHCAPTEPVK